MSVQSSAQMQRCAWVNTKQAASRSVWWVRFARRKRNWNEYASRIVSPSVKQHSSMALWAEAGRGMAIGPKPAGISLGIGRD